MGRKEGGKVRWIRGGEEQTDKETWQPTQEPKLEPKLETKPETTLEPTHDPDGRWVGSGWKGWNTQRGDQEAWCAAGGALTMMVQVVPTMIALVMVMRVVATIAASSRRSGVM